jgi:hypothetical protein
MLSLCGFERLFFKNATSLKKYFVAPKVIKNAFSLKIKSSRQMFTLPMGSDCSGTVLFLHINYIDSCLLS